MTLLPPHTPAPGPLPRPLIRTVSSMSSEMAEGNVLRFHRALELLEINSKSGKVENASKAAKRPLREVSVAEMRPLLSQASP